MKRFSEQFHKKAQSVKLKAVERDELRDRLVSYMEYHPLPAELRTKQRRTKTAPIMSDAFTTITLPFKTFMKAGAAFAVVMLVAVPYLAERAVPGDSLYAVKVQFNEEVRSQLTFDSAQRVEWETERLNRRIAEARLLASEGRLTEEVEAEVAEAVRTHTQNAQKEIAVLRELDADEATIASIALESTLEVQATALNKEQQKAQAAAEASSEEGEDVGNSTDLIAVAVNESRAQSDTAGSSTAPSYDKLMAKVEQNTTRIYELRNSIAPLVSESRLKDVTRRIEDTERAILAAIEAREENDEGARAQLIEVLQRTQKLIVFMTEIEVSETVDIEELVPVVLTPEEQVTKLAEYQTEITAKQATVRALLAETEDASMVDTVEKLAGAMNEVDGLLAEMAAAPEYQVRAKLAAEALALVNDALLTLEANSVTTTSTGVEVPTNSSSTASTSDEVVDPPEETAASSTEPVEEEVAEPEPVEVTEPAPEPEPTEATSTNSSTTVNAGLDASLEVSTSVVDTLR